MGIIGCMWCVHYQLNKGRWKCQCIINQMNQQRIFYSSSKRYESLLNKHSKFEFCEVVITFPCPFDLQTIVPQKKFAIDHIIRWTRYSHSLRDFVVEAAKVKVIILSAPLFPFLHLQFKALMKYIRTFCNVSDMVREQSVVVVLVLFWRFRFTFDFNLRHSFC